jgi:hypothetical protein
MISAPPEPEPDSAQLEQMRQMRPMLTPGMRANFLRGRPTRYGP